MSSSPSFRRSIHGFGNVSPVAPKAGRRRARRNTEGNALLPVCELQALEMRVLMSVAAELDVLPMPDLTYETAGTVEAGATGAAGVSYALSDTFLLHSRPGAKHTIYLDFDGHVTSGTIWNSNFTGGGNIVTPAFDMDGNASSFSNTELQTIQNIWLRVVEDFSPFDVDVTTEAPPSGDLIKSGSSDTRWGVRVAIGGSSYDWFGSGAGGVAYVGSFNWNSDTPTFVFTAQLGSGNEKYTAEAISHEVGHTLGLSHDGTSTTSYYSGQGSGTTGWAPIMGVGYYQNLTQWSKGEYAGANNKQDDLAIITTQNGFGYRIDDYGNTIGTAGALSVSGATVSGAGIIERTTDFDVFSFATGSGNISLSVAPAPRGPNLDILAELLNSNGTVIASSNPTDLLTASINTSVTAGTYYLRISGVGKGDPLTTGYTQYASLGQYSISGSVIPAGASLSISDVTVSESDGMAVFTISLSQASSSIVRVDVATANGSAEAGSDYQSVSIIGLTFDPGVTSRTISIPIINDLIGESTEAFFVNLSNASGAVILDGQGVGTIIDDDITIAISDASVTEGNPKGNGQIKTTDMIFTVSLSAASSNVITVQYATANGTASAGADYYSHSGTLTFNPGETSKTITVEIIGDTAVEPDETLFVNLFNASGAAIGNSQGVGTIIDDDSSGSGGGGNGKGGGKPGRGAVVGGSESTVSTTPAQATKSAELLSGSLLASLANAAFARYSAPGSAFQSAVRNNSVSTLSSLFSFDVRKGEGESNGFDVSEAEESIIQ